MMRISSIIPLRVENIIEQRLTPNLQLPYFRSTIPDLHEISAKCIEFKENNEISRKCFSQPRPLSYYSVIGSKTIKPNSGYAVTVSLLDASQPSFVTLTIQNDKNFKLMNSILVQPRSSQVVQFDIGNLDEGNYKLKAEGRRGFTFSNEMAINLPSKNQSVFIQTDKAMYKPGDIVKFRVLVLDSDTKPATVKNLNIFITDVTNNRIKQWLKVSTNEGVYTQELQLSSNPPLGIWNINVDVNNDVVQLKPFEVAEYVLPKFEVTVSAPKDLTYSDKIVRLTISAKYTYGQNVKGTALVSITSQSWSATPAKPVVEKRVAVDGNGFVEFPLVELNVNPQNWQDTFNVKASVTESLTGKMLEGTTTMTIRKTKFTVTNLDSERIFVPDNSFKLQLQFAYHDGSPFINTNSPIKVSYGPNYDKSNIKLLKSGNMDSKGLAKFDITLPTPSSTNGFYVFVQFLDYNDNVGYYTRQTSEISTTSNTISARLITKNAKISDTITVEITASKPLSYINYLLSSRGKLILSARKEIPSRNRFTITFAATFDMVPKAKLVVYHLLPNGDIVSTNIEVPVTGLNNIVKIQTSAAEKQPGEKINVLISTKPSSTVCLLGVDQSVVLLKSGNDILPSDVYTELGTYNNYVSSPIYGPIRPIIGPAIDRRSILPPRRRGGWADFDATNLVILTNANMPIVYIPWMPINFAGGVGVAMPMLTSLESNLVSPTTTPSILPAVRKYFPETWIYDCVTVRRGRMPFVDFEDVPPNSVVDSLPSQPHVPAPRIHEDIWFLRDMVLMDGAPLPAPPQAESPQPPMNAVAPRVRKYFPETWLWSCTLIGSGSLTIPETVPDTITSWYITAFATSNKHGLGVTDDKTVFKVFKNFFISLNLPYSIKRGETIALSIVVFNYMSQKVTAKVTLDNSRKEFEFVDPLTQVYKQKGCPPAIDSSRTKNVNIPSNDGAQLSFLITPLITGPLTIKVTATSSIAGDAIEVTLPVVPEGVPQFKNKAKFIDLRKSNTYSTDFTVDVPANAIKDSTQVSFSVIGDIMGVTLKNIQSLIQLPSGCGEQTMVGLAPDVVILAYLTKVGRLTAPIEKQLINYLEVGYQGELCYLHPDGSFSAFGKSDSSGSSWLTAFVVRIFIQAAEFITIDNGVITKALEWLKSLQKSDGSFPEPGRVIHTDMQGQSSKGVALTAYVIIAFAQNEANAKKYADVISKALSYVKTTLDSFTDLYSLSIACYAAHLANHPSKTAFMQKLDKLAKVQGDLKYWEKVKLASPSDPWCQPPSVNVEITSYALLSYIKAGRIVDGLPIMKWLLSQQSSTGGFSSTQDTVMGITALATFAGEISGGNVMSCTIRHGSGQSTIQLNKENALLLQSVELPRTTKSVSLKCSGNGFSLAQLSYQFNLNSAEQSPRFKLSAVVDKSSNDYHLVLNICTSFISGADGDKSNMAVIEAELPTGFVADLQTIREALEKMSDVKKVETRNGNTVVVIYLDNVSAKQICVQITAYRMCQIADEKPVSVQVYDYYNNSRRKTVFYQTKSKDLCGICIEDDCKAACKKPAKDVTCPKK
ncbi:CD109 antigen [Pseudolycoriella hygida]|uniref:TEP1-F n=1 Tax=Pseudolycoriella hygida TaxID=35572 RepID=A0A9Q0N632_9DIPT|nr:CD109 antigen [Pseudolycoriella hygida]